VFIYNQPKMNAIAIALPVVAADVPLIVTSVVAFNVPVTVTPLLEVSSFLELL
jgi:hypothetical protein